MVEDIKLFDVVDLSGVNETKGFHEGSKAYEFTKNTGDLVAFQNVSTLFAKEAFLVNQFAVKAYLLAADNSGTIIFLSQSKEKKAAAAFNLVFRYGNLPYYLLFLFYELFYLSI